MKIAMLGATSQIAKDLIISFSEDRNENHEVIMFSRSPDKVDKQFNRLGKKIKFLNLSYLDFNNSLSFDVIINFVGVGDPAQAKEMGVGIFEVTELYDNLAMNYLKFHPECKYIFMSSGAVYGGSFEKEVDEKTKAQVNINSLGNTDWYSIAKMYAESKHRAMSEYSIVDVRIFNYFSHTQDLSARFLITDIVRAIKEKKILKTNGINVVRDYITPPDFYNLILAVIEPLRINAPVDCYTKSTIDKFELLRLWCSLAKYLG